MHSHENSNKCNQCDFASALAFNLKTHLKTHSGEKSNKCSQCNFRFLIQQLISAVIVHKSHKNASIIDLEWINSVFVAIKFIFAVEYLIRYTTAVS